MADKVPVKGGYNGGSLTGLAEYATGDTLGVAHGGTGVVTIGSNQLLTGNGTSALTSESNLTFDGTILKATGDLCATVKVVSPALCIGSEYVLPTADGSAGQIMCTNGSGALAFATASSGVTLAGSTNNTIATVTGADALCGEANLTFDGSILTVGTSIAATADTDTSIGLPGSDVMTFGTGGTERMRIASDGDIGIGTATPTGPASRKHVQITGATTTGVGLIMGPATAVSNALVGSMSFYSGATEIVRIETGTENSVTNDGAISFDTAKSGTVTRRMTINSSGYVGIGTTAPASLLHLYAGATELDLQSTTGSEAARIRYRNTAGDYRVGVGARTGGGNFEIKSTSCSHPPGGITMTQDGLVGIGTATPGTLLHAEGTSGYMKFDPSGSDAALQLISTSGNTNFGTYNGSHLNFFTNSLKRMYISSGGQPRINTTDDYAQLEIGSSDGNGAIRTLQSGNATVATLYGWCTNYAGTVQQNIVGVNYSSSAFTYMGLDYQGANTHMKVRSDGQAYIDQTWNNGGADYAEYWESTDGTRLDVGKTVVLDGNKVRYYNAEIDTVDDIFGVTRPKGDEGGSSGVVGNSAWSNWNGKHKVDDFGRWIKGERVRLEWDDPDNPDDSKYASEGKYSYYEDEVPEGVTPPEDAVRTVEYVRLINDDFDPSLEYVAREERDEWNVVGLIGQIPIIATETVNPKWKKQRAISDATDEYYVG